MTIIELIESREQGNCMDVPMRDAAKELLAKNKQLKELLQKLSGWLSIVAIEEGRNKEGLQKRLSKAADKIEEAF